MRVLSALSIGLLVCTTANGTVFNVSGDFAANNNFPSTGAGDGNGATLSGSWSLRYDDAVANISGIGEELVPVALLSLSLSPNPLGATTFDLSNTGAAMIYVDGELAGVVVGGTVNGPETVNNDTDDFFVNNSFVTNAPGSVVWSIASAPGISRDRSPAVGGTTSGTVTIVIDTPSAEDLLNDLMSTVFTFNLQRGINNALDQKLQNAMDAVIRAQTGDGSAVPGVLQAFIHSVEAQRGKKISETQADELTSRAQAIIDLLGQPN